MFDKFKKDRLPLGVSQGKDATPYLNARRSWNDHAGGLLASKRLWQAVALLCLTICVGAVGGIIHIGEQSKFIPYVVQVDSLGQAVTVSQADRAAPVDERVIHACIAAFVADARLVTPDVALQRAAIFRLYAFLSGKDPATQKMNEWLNGNPEANPLKRAAKETVSTEIISVIPQTPETWQVDWREYVHDRQGAPKEEYVMRALLTYYVVRPDSNTTMEQIRRNPLGIYIRDFSWSKLAAK
jgi:type IV secretion system protein VirB5